MDKEQMDRVIEGLKLQHNPSKNKKLDEALDVFSKIASEKAVPLMGLLMSIKEHSRLYTKSHPKENIPVLSFELMGNILTPIFMVCGDDTEEIISILDSIKEKVIMLETMGNKV